MYSAKDAITRSKLSTVPGELWRHGGECYVNQFRIGKAIARGRYSQYVEGVHKESGKAYAVKVVHVAAALREMSAMQSGYELTSCSAWDKHVLELTLQSTLSQSSLVKLYTIIACPKKSVIFCIYEKAYSPILIYKSGSYHPPGGGKLKRSFVYAVFKEVAAALHYLHSKGVTHCDVKPENILLRSPLTESEVEGGEGDSESSSEGSEVDDFLWSEDRDCSSTQWAEGPMEEAEGRIRLVDLNSAVHGLRTTGGDGTTHFNCPESIFEQPGGIDGPKRDVWALGVTLYAMLTNTLPFSGNNEFEVLMGVKEGVFSTEGMSDEDAACVRKILNTDPQQRPTAGDLALWDI